MITLNLNYATDENGYSDGSVELDLARRLKNGETPEDILKTQQTWPYVYHLSPVRENILNWFDFKKGCSILEIGSGCGALTELLSKKADEVTSIELTRQRAEINYLRNQNCNNVEIIVGNFNDIKLTRKFDYIILNGVLEYAASFTDADHPYTTFLDKVLTYLKKDGTLIIAIENRFGLKYLNGVPEDHTGVLFTGVNGYAGVDSVRTFTKNELRNLLYSVGLDYMKFFYPFPDYKLPEVIVTDESFERLPLDNIPFTYNAPRLQFFEDRRVTESLIREGVMDRFANSFLVMASRKEQALDQTKFVKFSTARSKRFALGTIIEEVNGKKQVRKIPLTDQSKEHFKRIAENYKKFNGKPFAMAPLKVEGDDLVFEFLEGDTLEKRLLDLLEEGNKEAFAKILNLFAQNLLEDTQPSENFETETFKKVFGDTLSGKVLNVKENSNIDLLFSNIIDDEKGHILDYEWIFDFDIPQEFVLFRSLYYLYNQNHQVSENFSLEELVSLVTKDGKPVIEESLIPVFIDWDEHFGLSYVRGEHPELEPRAVVNVASELQDRLDLMSDEGSVYLDFGDGFNESTRIKSNIEYNKDNNFKVIFDLRPVKEAHEGAEVIGMRWDPLETSIEISDLNITSEGGAIEYKLLPPYVSKHVKLDENIIFLDEDPYLLIYGGINDVDTITITGKMNEIKTEDLFAVINDINNRLQDYTLTDRNRVREIQTLKFEKLELNDQITNLAEEVKKLKGEI